MFPDIGDFILMCSQRKRFCCCATLAAHFSQLTKTNVRTEGRSSRGSGGALPVTLIHLCVCVGAAVGGWGCPAGVH